MNLFNSQNQKHYSSNSKHNNKNKKRLTPDQVSLLETNFDSNKKLEPERKLQLASELGIPQRQIAIWYQNKRARWKAQSLELDYNALQLSLEAALADKRRLERDVQRLRGELEKAQEMVLANLNQAAVAAVVSPPPVSSLSLSSCCDHHHERERWRSSSLHDHDHDDDDHHHVITCSTNWVNDDHVESLKLEELYACLMGTNESSHS